MFLIVICDAVSLLIGHPLHKPHPMFSRPCSSQSEDLYENPNDFLEESHGLLTHHSSCLYFPGSLFYTINYFLFFGNVIFTFTFSTSEDLTLSKEQYRLKQK